MLTQVLINGVDVTSALLTYEYEATYGDTIGQINLKFLNLISNILELSPNQTIVVKRGWTSPTEDTIFQGYIESLNSEAGLMKIVAKDKMWDLVRREVNHTYDINIDLSAGKMSEIFKDLVTTYGGLNADNISIQDSGIEYVIQKFACIHADIFERCQALADALDWQFYYRSDTDKVYFEPKGFSQNSTQFFVGTNIYNIPQWKYDLTEMVNDLFVIGAFQEVETTETGRIGTTNGYATDGISLGYTPISVKVYMDTSNPPLTLRQGGAQGSSSSYYYEVDKDNKKILPYSAFTTGDYAEIRYSRAVPIPIHLQSPTSMTAYGTFTKTITYEDLRTVDDAEKRGTNYLTLYSTPFIYATLKVKNESNYALRVGQMINVIDNISLPAVNENLCITRQRIRYPADYDELDIGDKQWRLAEWQSRVMEEIKRLNEKEFQNQDMQTEVRTFDNTLLYPIVVKPRYQKVTYDEITDPHNIFILDNPLCDKLDTNHMDGTGWSRDNIHIVQQYKNIYTENFIDTDFKDTANTSAGWSNTGYLEMI